MIPARPLHVLLPLILLGSCSRPEPATPSETRPNAPSLQSTRAPSYRLVALLLDDPQGSEARALTPAGIRTLRLSEQTRVAPGLGRGSYVDVECDMRSDGRLDALIIERPRGLPVTFGTLVSLEETAMVVENPLGQTRLGLNTMSDLSPGLSPGQFIDVKYYDLDGVPTVLNARQQPGHFETWGMVRALERDGVLVQTLKEESLFEIEASEAADLAVGDHVRLMWTEGLQSGRTILGVEEVEDLLFIGKLAEFRPKAGELRLVDTWQRVQGIVTLYLEPGFRLDPSWMPGDLLEIRYRFREVGRSEAGRPPSAPQARVVSCLERPLSPIYFGELTALEPDHLVIRTLQGNSWRVRVTPETLRPRSLAVGDLADVVYRAGAPGQDPEARLIVKE